MFYTGVPSKPVFEALFHSLEDADIHTERNGSSKGGHPGTLAESVPECPPLAKIVPDCPSGGQSGMISSQFALCEGQTGTAVPDCPLWRAIWDGLPN